MRNRLIRVLTALGAVVVTAGAMIAPAVSASAVQPRSAHAVAKRADVVAVSCARSATVPTSAVVKATDIGTRGSAWIHGFKATARTNHGIHVKTVQVTPFRMAPGQTRRKVISFAPNRVRSCTAVVLFGRGAVVVPAVAVGMCAGEGSGLCLHLDNGFVTTNVHGDITSNDKVTLPALTNMCQNGVATSTCPFAAGSNYNPTFSGDPITEISFGRADTCAGNDNNRTVPMRDCIGGGTNTTGDVWVIHGYEFVNVYQTNRQYSVYGITGDASALTSLGHTTYDANAISFEPGYSQWAAETP